MNAEERLVSHLCSQPGSGHMDEYHAGFARQILDQHAEELTARQSTHQPGRTEGRQVIHLADQLRETATALANLSPDAIATTDDPLTLLRCLHATVEALTEIAPAALTAADIHQTPGTAGGIANIPGLINLGLKGAATALHDATNCV